VQMANTCSSTAAVQMSSIFFEDFTANLFWCVAVLVLVQFETQVCFWFANQEVKLTLEWGTAHGPGPISLLLLSMMVASFTCTGLGNAEHKGIVASMTFSFTAGGEERSGPTDASDATVASVIVRRHGASSLCRGIEVGPHSLSRGNTRREPPLVV
jgi:hypothetical protein